MVTLLGAVAIAGLACDGGALAVCNLPGSSAPPVAVFVRDAESNAFIASGATVVFSHEYATDSIVVPPGRADLNAEAVSPAPFAWLAGTYSVTVRRSGYAEWSRVGVQARVVRCELLTTTLTAKLQPTP